MISKKKKYRRSQLIIKHQVTFSVLQEKSSFFKNTVQEAECWLSQEQLKPHRVSLKLKLLHSWQQKKSLKKNKQIQGLRTFSPFSFSGFDCQNRPNITKCGPI